MCERRWISSTARHHKALKRVNESRSFLLDTRSCVVLPTSIHSVQQPGKRTGTLGGVVRGDAREGAYDGRDHRGGAEECLPYADQARATEHPTARGVRCGGRGASGGDGQT